MNIEENKVIKNIKSYLKMIEKENKKEITKKEDIHDGSMVSNVGITIIIIRIIRDFNRIGIQGIINWIIILIILREIIIKIIKITEIEIIKIIITIIITGEEMIGI